jgi:hypothetical protein
MVKFFHFHLKFIIIIDLDNCKVIFSFVDVINEGIENINLGLFVLSS